MLLSLFVTIYTFVCLNSFLCSSGGAFRSRNWSRVKGYGCTTRVNQQILSARTIGRPRATAMYSTSLVRVPAVFFSRFYPERGRVSDSTLSLSCPAETATMQVQAFFKKSAAAVSIIYWPIYRCIVPERCVCAPCSGTCISGPIASPARTLA